jgi:hypothetical protein
MLNGKHTSLLGSDDPQELYYGPPPQHHGISLRYYAPLHRLYQRAARFIARSRTARLPH